MTAAVLDFADIRVRQIGTTPTGRVFLVEEPVADLLRMLADLDRGDDADVAECVCRGCGWLAKDWADLGACPILHAGGDGEPFPACAGHCAWCLRDGCLDADEAAVVAREIGDPCARPRAASS